MELNKYYSLDECSKSDEVFQFLNDLQDDLKIEYEIIDNDNIKIVDNGLTLSEIKKIISFFDEMDVIENNDYDDYDDDYDDYKYDDYDDYNNDY